MNLMTRHKALFLLLCIVIFLIIHNLYKLIYANRHFHLDSILSLNQDFINLLVVSSYFIVIIPLTLFISYKTLNFFIKNKFCNNKLVYAILLIMIGITVLLLISDYRKKELSKLINFEVTDIEYLEIDEKKVVISPKQGEELLELLGDYQVKRLRDRNWYHIYNNSQNHTYRVFIHLKNDKHIIFYFKENLLEFVNKDKRYEIINGPMDTEWFDRILNEE